MSKLNEYTIPQLQEKLEAAGIEFKKSANKDELIELLEGTETSTSEKDEESNGDSDESSSDDQDAEGKNSKTIKADNSEGKKSAKKSTEKKTTPKSKTVTKKVESNSVKIGAKTYRFKKGVEKLQIAGDVLPVSEILKDLDTMRALVRANSPFVESVNK